MSNFYSTPQLEGRALEHALAGNAGFKIRMKNPTTLVFEAIGGDLAKNIRIMMRDRVAALRTSMKEQGLFIQDADCPVDLGDEERSVDVRLWSSSHYSDALVEVKWTRRNLEKALRLGKKSITMLKKACRQGVWSRSRSKVKASMVGVMVVMPGQWCCILCSAGGSEWTRYPVAREQAVSQRRGGKSQSGAQKRKSNEHLRSLEHAWRKTKIGKAGKTKNQQTYRRSDQGRATRKEANRRHYLKRKATAETSLV